MLFPEAGEPIAIRSPGRVNLIGEHTDYNDGFVLPAAIDKSITLVIAARPDAALRIYAADLDDRYSGRLDSLTRSTQKWANHLLGVIDQLQRFGAGIGGMDIMFGGDIPIGAGLSSSAAIEGGLAFAINELFQCGIDKRTLALLAQKAEHEFVGVQCGIMDQFINLFGKTNRVVKLDCRSLDYEYFPFEREDLRIVLCDTQVRRELATSEYNVRKQQCLEGVRRIQRHEPSMRSLRDVSFEMLDHHRHAMDDVIYRRCHYVLKENSRVLTACHDLTRSDFTAFGARMFESHAGLRDEYEVSSPELDTLVEIASSLPGVLGARLMGAGFGGCTINLVEHRLIEEFVGRIRRGYHTRLNKELKIHICRIQSGTSVIQPLQDVSLITHEDERR